MSKITEVAKGLKTATYAVHHDEYNKGTYIIDKQ